jgi:hypothetical protein
MMVGGRPVKSGTRIFSSVYDAIQIIWSVRPELQQSTMLSYLLLSLIILSCIFFVFYTLLFQIVLQFCETVRSMLGIRK